MIESESILQLLSGQPKRPEAEANKIYYPADGSEKLSEAERNHFWFVARRSFVKSLLQSFIPARSENVIGIDVGCGTGFNAVWLTESGWPTVGLDAYSGFEKFKIEGRGVGFLQADLSQMKPAAEFDFVLLLDVIEHLEDDQNFLDRSLALLKPGGVAIVTVPAFQFLWSPVDVHAGHQRRYIKRDMEKLMTNSRFSSDLRPAFSSYLFASTLPLFFLSRLISKLRKRDDKATAELKINGLLNGLFKTLLKLEMLIARFISLPIGSSLIFAIRKNR